MEKPPPTQLSPSHSHSSCASSRSRAHGYLYDDYAREIPALPRIEYLESRGFSKQTKKKSPLCIVVWLAVIVFFVQLGGA